MGTKAIKSLRFRTGYSGKAILASNSIYSFNPSVSLTGNTLVWKCDNGYGNVIADVPNYPFTLLGIVKTMEVIGSERILTWDFANDYVNYLDASGMTETTYLRIRSNAGALDWVNFSQCTKLDYLYLDLGSGWNTASLDLSNQALLTDLQLTDVYDKVTDFPTIDHMPILDNIRLEGFNDTDTINFLSNTIIDTIDVRNGEWSGLSMVGLTNLTTCYIQGNPSLLSFDMTGCSSLRDFFCSNNTGITFCTLTGCDVIYRLDLTNCSNLTTVTLPAVLNDINTLKISNTQVTSLDLSGLGSGNTFKYFYMEGCNHTTAQLDTLLSQLTNMTSGASSSSLRCRNNRTVNIISSGITDSNTSNTLIDSTATFITDGVALGDLVIETGANAHCKVTSIISETQLVTSRGAYTWFASGKSYTIDNSSSARGLAQFAFNAQGAINESYTT